MRLARGWIVFGRLCNVAGMTGEAPRFHRALGWGLAASLVVRAALAARATIIETDGAYWAGLAAALERGDYGHGLSTAWPPLYPALIAAALHVARIAGRPPDPATVEICARAVSVVAGTLLLVPLFALGRRLLSPRAAVIAVALAAVHPRMLQYSAAALSEATFTLLLLQALALLVARERDPEAARARPAREAASGALLGLAYLARPEGLPLAAALWMAGVFRRPPAAAPGADRTPVARLRPAFALATLAVALPWLLFLHGALGRWSLGEKGEYNFWRAFSTEYAADYPAPAGLAARVNESPEIAPAPAGAAVHVLEFTLRHPATVLGRCVRNLLTILASTLPVTLYWPIVPFAILALFCPRAPGVWPVVTTLVALPLVYAPFSVDRRFFVPAVPLLLIACAAGIERAESWLARRAGAAGAGRIVNAAVALLAALSVAYAFAKGSGFERAPEHRRAGEWLRHAMAPASQQVAARMEASGAVPNRPVVISRKPWVAFYSGGLIAALPDVPPESLLALARTKGAEVLVADERSARADRPRLASFLDPAPLPSGWLVFHREAGPPALVLYGLPP